MTMQTTQPLEHVTLSQTHRPIEWFTILDERGESGLDMDQPYQRGDVWGIKRRRNLMRSFMLGVPIPAVVVNHRMGAKFRGPGYDQDRNWAYAVVDGKQRVTTILMWFRDEFALPSSWFPANLVDTTIDTPDGPYVHFTGLTRSGQRRWMNYGIPVVEARVSSLAAEQAIFDLINYGGVAQGEADDD